MLNFFLPRKTKKVLAEAELIFATLKRNRIYTQDTISAKNLEALDELEKSYPALRKAKDVEGLEKWNDEAMKLGNKVFPPTPWDAWRENVEVFVVAAIMALSIRTYFLQPFKIPTGSMEPTLYGIEPNPTTAQAPNALYQVYDFLIHGRTYSHIVTEHGGKVTTLTSGTMTIWFEYTDVHLAYMDNGVEKSEVDRIWIRAQDVESKLGIYPYEDPVTHVIIRDKTYQPGEVLANYVTQTGDQVLVDKVTYNFRPPHTGEVIIFKTSGIPKLAHERGADQEGSEDFIKRCIAFSGDLVEVKPPALYLRPVGGTESKLVEGAPSFQKEFSQTNHYPGYSIYDLNDNVGDYQNGVQSFYVPDDCYWAMGDNSPASKDSRNWGGVPRQNLVGRGYFVFWPFTERWGWIK